MYRRVLALCNAESSVPLVVIVPGPRVLPGPRALQPQARVVRQALGSATACPKTLESHLGLV